MAFTLFAARVAMEKFSGILGEKEDFLTELDSAIGDADHGANMNRGVKIVLERIRANEYDDFGGFYRDVAMSVMDGVGGSAGPLYGTFFMKMAQRLTGRDDVPVALLADAMREAAEALAALGKSSLGDKTMLDVLKPAIDALSASSAKGDGAAWSAAVQAAERGVGDTVPMVAKRGRSSYLGEVSAGHQDPGATSALYLITSFRDASQEV